MKNYCSGVENTPDYLEKESKKFVDLLDLYQRAPETQIKTYLRMMYGHVDWEDLIYTLDDETINMLRKNKSSVGPGREVFDRLKKGVCVAILNSDTMGPVTYKDMLTGRIDIELCDLDQAIERAAFWFVDDTLESVYTYSLFTPYFLLAFRLALMEGEMTDEERFEEARLDEVWRNTYSTVLFFAGLRLQNEAIDMVKKDYRMPFNLNENDVEEYLTNLEAYEESTRN